jgi:hypothetical protein
MIRSIPHIMIRIIAIEYSFISSSLYITYIPNLSSIGDYSVFKLDKYYKFIDSEKSLYFIINRL